MPKVSLNPLPPERLIRSSEEREKSSEPGQNSDESETGSHGDIEDNLDDTKHRLSISFPDATGILRNMKPFKPDPERLDPHMEALCRKVRKFSVSTADPIMHQDSLDGQVSVPKEYDLSDNQNEEDNLEEDMLDKKHHLRLQNDWIARSLTSVAPR